MINTKTIIVKAVNLLKSGVNPKTNRTWYLFKITDENGTEYLTFSNSYQSKINQAVEIYFQETERKVNDKIYKSLMIVDRKKAEAELRHEEIKKILKTIYDKLQNIENLLTSKQ